ncbi:hypothetical protein J4Q44_G00019340 [Coregonus suidteri]|uniref:Uncharacterized protein n=1 Tax=Coregonus suidteri TaxID=861788 RepID=A0AAN8MB14_9TELE
MERREGEACLGWRAMHFAADWKHHEARKEPGAFSIDRSYSYSASLGKYYNKVTELKDTVVAASSSSLNSGEPLRHH